MITEGMAIWTGTKLVPGPEIGKIIEEIEASKCISGGFHSHVANRIFSTILAD
jgi:hypothetical protein